MVMLQQQPIVSFYRQLKKPNMIWLKTLTLKVKFPRKGHNMTVFCRRGDLTLIKNIQVRVHFKVCIRYYYVGIN